MTIYIAAGWHLPVHVFTLLTKLCIAPAFLSLPVTVMGKESTMLPAWDRAASGSWHSGGLLRWIRLRTERRLRQHENV